MFAANYNIVLDQGADWSIVLTLNDSNGDPVNLNGATFVGEVRELETLVRAAEFTLTASSPTTLGQLTIALTDTQTASFTRTDGYIYDIFWTKSGIRNRLLEGTVTVRNQVSRF